MSILMPEIYIFLDEYLIHKNIAVYHVKLRSRQKLS